MKQRMFCVWLAVTGIIFAALTLGGCGGSSSNNGLSSIEDNVSMSKVWNDDEAMNEVISRLTSDDLVNIMFTRIEGIKQQDDGAVNMQYFDTLKYAVSGEEYPEVPYDKDELLTHYESGDVILMFDAALDLINKVRTDLGLVSEDAGLIGPSGSLEVYGLACVRTDGMRNTFTYVVPRLEDIIASDDIAGVGNIQSESRDTNISADEEPEQDEQEDDPETAPKEYTMREFQIERVVRFFKWLGNMSMMAIENAEFASAPDKRVFTTAMSDLKGICMG